MKRFLMIGGALLLGLALIGGCHRTVNTVGVGESISPEYKWIQTDSGVSQICNVVSARKTRVNDLLKVQVELTNQRNHDERFVYKFQWLDANGMEVSSITNDWTAKVINGRETVMIQGIAPTSRVTDCRLLMQENVR